MALESEFYHKRFLRSEEFLGGFTVKPGTFHKTNFFYPSEIRMFIGNNNTFSTVLLKISSEITARKYLDDLDKEGVDINTQNDNRVKLYPGQELYLQQQTGWREWKTMVLWMNNNKS